MSNKNSYDTDKGEYQFPLAGFIEVMIQRWGEDRKTFWEGGGPKDIINAEEIDKDIFELASKIYDVSKNPINPKELKNAFQRIDLSKFPWDKSEIFESDFFQYLWERLEESLAYDSVRKWEDAATNMLKFFIIFQGHEDIEIPKPVSIFLKLVIRNYVWDFEPECIILCRSAMEAAFRDTIDQSTLENYLGSSMYQEFSIKDYIYTAKNEGMITDEYVEKANKIRTRANKALHYEPHATKEIFETMSDTFKIIIKLSSKR